MRIDLLIFDLDGTLVETSEDLRDAVNHAVAPYGAGPYDTVQTISMVGEGVESLIRKSLGPSLAKHTQPALAGFMGYYTQHIADHSYAYAGVAEALDTLKDTKKAVLSNKSEALCRLLLQKLGLAHHFALIAGSDTYETMKPSPLPVFRILSKLSVTVNHAAMVGDSAIDIETSRRAGLKTIGCAYGFRGREALLGADFIVDSLAEVPALFKAHAPPSDRRSEERFTLPELFHEYIQITVRIGDDEIPVKLDDFSEHGLRVTSPVPFDPGTKRHFTVSMPKSMPRGVGLTAVIRHCLDGTDCFLVGCQIVDVEDDMWFRVFKNSLHFITDRAGEVY